MKESMKERSGLSAPVATIAAVTPTPVTAIPATSAAIPMIIVVVPEERGEKLPLLDLHESFV
jgi:hypothetical protein